MATQQPKLTAFTFDASKVTPQANFEPIPGGWYPSVIVDAEIKPTKGANAGKVANFTYEITAGDYKGRKIFGRMNVENKNPQTQEIGQRELSALCHAVQIVNVSDLSVFVGKPVEIKVKLKQPDAKEIAAGYTEAKNEVTGFKALAGATVPAVGAPPFGAPPVAVAPPPIVAPPAIVDAFPPVGWTLHPHAPGHYFNAAGEVKTEAELRALATPPAVAAPPVPAVPAVPAAPAVEFPPAGWVAHPQSPGWYYNAANPQDMKQEAELRALATPPAVAAPPVPAVPAVPAVPTPPPAPAGGSVPPWQRQG